ncbi:uncharacterized protein [Spinacia oleracea]|uniref:Reverse transcriptase zinc-binding domain-containing protein n=1 Tax=Spinacia oleracea TaxID=3562 RepID=A0ABM3QPW5_SPIOL|nr:uncharacterized protein LOC130461354 [Spinacia oleracea]
MGGLGIRCLSDLNKAYLMKQVWRMKHNPQLLVSKVYSAKWPFNLDIGRKVSFHGKVLSWGLRGLRRAENRIIEGCAWKIGNGRSVSAGGDKWVNGCVPIFSSNVTLAQARNWKVRDFINQGSGGWKEPLIRQSFSFDSVVAISAMENPNIEEHDFLFWASHPSGNLSIKSAYAFLQLSQGLGEPRHSTVKWKDFYKILWRIPSLPKWKFFLWRISYEGLAVKDQLSLRGIDISLSCEECGDPLESMDHLFRFSLYSMDGIKSTRIIFFMVTLWELWVARNNRVFRNEVMNVRSILDNISCSMELHVRVQSGNLVNLAFLHPPELTNSPPPGFHLASIGYAFSISRLHIGRGGSDFGSIDSATHAEALACSACLSWASARGFSNIVIFTDYFNLVSMLQGKSLQDIGLKWTIQQLVSKGASFHSCVIYKVDREIIAVAHQKAQLGLHLAISSSDVF